MKNLVVVNVLKLAWANYGKVTITEIIDNILMFDFERETNRKTILELGPWSRKLTGRILNMERYNGSLGQLEHLGRKETERVSGPGKL